MKQLLVFAIMICLMTAFEARGQISKGTTFAGWSLEALGRNFQRERDFADDYKSTNHTVKLGIQWGKFTRDNFLLGVGLIGAGFWNRDNYENNTVKLNDYQYGIQPFLRWYKPVFSKLYVYAEPSLTLGIYTSKEINETQNGVRATTKSNNYAGSIGIAPGISYRIGEKFALEAAINLFTLKVDYLGGDDLEGSLLVVNASASSRFNSLFSVRGAFYLN